MIDIVLPCLDEAAALPHVLGDLPDGTRALVVDNGSTDGSPEIARSLGAHVVTATQRGYGAACHAGLMAATADLVAFVDCDGSFDLSIVPALAAPVLDGSADLAVGRRRPVARGAWPAHARLANGVLSWRLRTLGLPVHDVGAVRVARRTALIDLAQIDRRSGYPLETMVLAAKAGWRVVETDVDYHPRHGRSKVTGTVRGTVQAMRDMTVVLAR
ncbi:glycosyltransferase family 2 protein [Allobranchiibius huperziae]|uniref:dTDP-L-rhamnose 4-epimerase n=1 Tax=Allobranchiibius huperziae TaxID=1874116 RepID=A0A853DGG1_9MICO|nr:glycosyltransferase family 2 protein [Allobranchiibius huperziae]NYJ75777.1 dTDP-L-rhamnose 4-epimerase [Allobranchiibius huperziae]